MDWNNINRDRDTSGLGPIEYDQTKVPALIRKHADNVRTKTYGQEVREAQARNAEVAGLIASESVDISNETKERQDAVETQFNSIQQELTDKDVISAPEIIAARKGAETLNERLDSDKDKFDKRTSLFVSITEFGAIGDDITDCTDAFNRAILSGKKILVPDGIFRAEGVVDFSKAPMGSYNIEGNGENSQIHLVGENAKIYDKYARQDDRNYHIKSMKDIYLRGDGTNIGLDFQSLQMHAENVTIFGFHTGMKISNGGYGSSFTGFKFQDNIVDIDLNASANAIQLINLNIDGHGDDTEACVKLNGSCDHLYISGIIESSQAPAIWFTSGFSGNVKVELYMELLGDDNKGIPAIRNDSTSANVNVIYQQSRFGFQDNIRTTGKYQLGKKPTVLNSKIDGEFVDYDTLSINDSYLSFKGCHQVHNPIIFSGLTKIGSTWGGGGDTGIAVQIPAKLDTGYENSIINNVTDPFCETGKNVSAIGTNAPTVEHDTITKFGSRNTSKVSFANGIAGSSSDNKISLTYGNQIINPSNIIIASVMIKANKPAVLTSEFRGDRLMLKHDFKVDTKWRKFVFIGKNTDTVDRYVWTNIFPSEAYDDLVINVTASVVYRNISNDPLIISEVLSGKLNY